MITEQNFLARELDKLMVRRNEIDNQIKLISKLLKQYSNGVQKETLPKEVNGQKKPQTETNAKPTKI